MKINLQAKTRRRFLFSCIGGYGHFHPLVPLARALREAGHEVAFAVGASLQRLAETGGFTVFLLSDKRELDPEFQRFRARLNTMPSSLETELFIYSRLFCGIRPRLRLPHLLRN